MKKLSKTDYKALASAGKKVMRAGSLDEEVKKIRLKTIAASTLKQYRCLVRGLSKFLEELQEPSMNKNLFLLWVVSMDHIGRGGVDTPKQVLSALRKLQAIEGLWDPEAKLWAFDPQLDEACKGLAYQGKDGNRRVARGAITRVMLEELITYCRSHNAGRMVPAFQIAFGGGLRVKQVAHLKCDALIRDETKSFVCVLKDKRVRATAMRSENHVMEIDEQGARVFEALAYGREPAEFLFKPQDWKYPDLLRTLHEAGVALRWPADLNWVFHSLRHGQAVDTARESHRMRMTPKTLRRYKKENTVRVKKARSTR
jgi:integrase